VAPGTILKWRETIGSGQLATRWDNEVCVFQHLSQVNTAKGNIELSGSLLLAFI
jgi:hypothetical protein